MRKTWATWIIFAPFAGCIAFAYAWFNLPSANSQLPSPNSQTNSQPRLWLTARTNIPGYTFVPEPVSDAVKKTLGTTNIVSGTFYKTGDRSLEIGVGERKQLNAQSLTTNSQLLTSNCRTNSHPRLWHVARTNIPGYVFVPEPVSELVMKTVSTTNILSGTLVSVREDESQMSVLAVATTASL